MHLEVSSVHTGRHKGQPGDFHPHIWETHGRRDAALVPFQVTPPTHAQMQVTWG